MAPLKLLIAGAWERCLSSPWVGEGESHTIPPVLSAANSFGACKRQHNSFFGFNEQVFLPVRAVLRSVELLAFSRTLSKISESAH